MSQSVKEFVRQSGVDVQNSDSNSNNNFAQELEADMFRMIQERKARESSVTQGQQFFRAPPKHVQFPRRLQRNIVNNQTPFFYQTLLCRRTITN